MQKNDIGNTRDILIEKWFYWGLFILLFSYAAIRAWLVVPMLDEISTFFTYIRTGNYFNTIEALDANNHVLNSFLGHQFYTLFGDVFFLFRLPSLLAFALYFFSMKYIVQQSLPKNIRIIVFLSLVSIPWIFEYFSYSRGYSTAIAFYFAAIAFILRWKSSNNWGHFIAFFICTWFAIVSNLTYLLPSLILMVYIEFLFILKGEFNKRKIIINSSVLLGWIAAIVPFIAYSLRLKEAEALWWGNKDGLWETTGKSLSSLVLFTDSLWVFYIVSSLIVFCAFVFFRNWIKNDFWDYLKKTEAMLFVIFIGSLVGIILMGYLLDVNYPQDRVGMNLVPTFILFVSLFLSKYHLSKNLLWLLLFFPITFVYHLNTTTSIYSPEDRIPTSLTDQIKANLTDQNSISAEYVSHLSYAYSCRTDQKVHMAYTTDSEIKGYGDYHISWLGCNTIDGYKTITQHPESKTCYQERDQKLEKTILLDTLIKNIDFKDEYFTILKRPITDRFKNKEIQIQIDGDMEFDRPTSKFNIIQSFINETNESAITRSPQFNWYFSDRTDVSFTFTDQIIKLNPEETLFHFYLYNNDLNQIKVEFIHIRIYQINR